MRALLTSDTADGTRVEQFSLCVRHVMSGFLDPALESEVELREMTIDLLVQILRQKRSTDVVMEWKSVVVALGRARVSRIRVEDGGEDGCLELEHWETLLSEIENVGEDFERSDASDEEQHLSPPILMLADRSANVDPQTLPQ